MTTGGGEEKSFSREGKSGPRHTVDARSARLPILGRGSQIEPVLKAVALALLFPVALAREPLPARWYDHGHRIVARLAELRLTPRTRDAIRDILGGQSLSDASVWADNIRQYRHDADKLHYVNIALGERYVPGRDCPGGRCIIAAIERDRQILADPTTAPEDRAEALKFLVHFMGDLHQPLHVADDGDRGGNSRKVELLGHSTNLHKAWDGGLIEAFGMEESEYFDALRREMGRMDLAVLERGSVVDWAMEGHRTAVERVYRPIPPDGQLGQAYVETSRPVVDHALISAGVRLAKVLNDALASYRPR